MAIHHPASGRPQHLDHEHLESSWMKLKHSYSLMAEPFSSFVLLYSIAPLPDIVSQPGQIPPLCLNHTYQHTHLESLLAYRVPVDLYKLESMAKNHSTLIHPTLC